MLDEDTMLLTPEQLRCLDVHSEVQRKVRDPRLMAILARVDAAKDGAAALRKEMEDPAFVEFCDDVLDAIGVKEPPGHTGTL